MHLCRSSSNVPRLPSLLEMPQKPHVLSTFGKVQSPLRLPHKTTSREWCVLYILTWKCASRHNGVHFLDISTSKSGPIMVCFVHFDLEMCFAPQQRTLLWTSQLYTCPRNRTFARNPRLSHKVCEVCEVCEGLLPPRATEKPQTWHFAEWFIVLPVYILVSGGGRFRPFLLIVLELFYPSTYFLGSVRFRPFVYVVLESKPIITDLLRTAWGGWRDLYPLCVCVYRSNPLLYLSTYCFRGMAKFYKAEERCENGGKRLGERLVRPVRIRPLRTCLVCVKSQVSC